MTIAEAKIQISASCGRKSPQWTTRLRLFLPPRSHRYNELPKAGPWVLAPLLPLPAVLAAEGLRRISPAFEAALDRHARRRSRRWLERQLGEREAEYQPVQSFTR